MILRALTCPRPPTVFRLLPRRTATRRSRAGRDLHVADSEKFETHAHDQQAADGAHLPQLQIGQESDEQRGTQCQAALIHEDEWDREEHAPSKRRGERDRGEPVEHALDGEEARVAGEAVLDRPEECQRTDAEHDRRGHERLGDGARRTSCETALQRVAELSEPRVDPGERAEDPTEQHRAEHEEQVARLDRELHPHGEHEQADPAHDVFSQRRGEPVAQCRTKKTADEDRRRVEERSREGGHEGP